MEKTKYRYKCMVCGTEEVRAGEMLSCEACGSDDLAKFEVAAPSPPKKKAPRRRTKKTPSEQAIEDFLKSIEVGASSSASPPLTADVSGSTSSPKKPSWPVPPPLSTKPTASGSASKSKPHSCGPYVAKPFCWLKSKIGDLLKKIGWKKAVRFMGSAAIGFVAYLLLRCALKLIK